TGASKGIGAAIARTLAAHGAAVAVNYSSSREAAEKVVAGITAAGGKAFAVGGDVTKKADIEAIFAKSKEVLGRLDILVNNAGIYAPTPIGAITEEAFHRHFNLNVLGVLLASQEAVKYFSTEGGVIVNVSSVVAAFCPPGLSVYNATKGAVDSITRTFARELAGRNIRVNSVNPGLIATEGTHAAGFAKPNTEESSALGLIGEPAAIADIVAFLASPDSRWINGQVHYATGDLL
ncbi:MAG: SDR family NAD(P)-dependent oxidoreductase, partial [Candidatus Methylacidiphilales bacterium]|nr:SDR family oxidoreductase [Candidatus Methylacidiphilales bacterium]